MRYFMIGYVYYGGAAGSFQFKIKNVFPNVDFLRKYYRIKYEDENIIITSISEFKNKEEFDIFYGDSSINNGEKHG